MSHLALASPIVRTAPSPANQWAHDIRNTLTTLGLHLDTLERLAGPAGLLAAPARGLSSLPSGVRFGQWPQHLVAEPFVKRPSLKLSRLLKNAPPDKS
jgi:hypothetical protein